MICRSLGQFQINNNLKFLKNVATKPKLRTYIVRSNIHIRLNPISQNVSLAYFIKGMMTNVRNL